jgi:threonine aldolase
VSPTDANRPIDLRSDTVTHPTPSMRRAMADAELGDDVYGEDPTVNRLEEVAAARLGKEAALLVASGTMGNLVSLLTHCGRGDEVILGNRSHSFYFEQGGMAALGGIQPHPIQDGPDGQWDLQVAEAAVRPDNEHFPRTRAIAIENTHNQAGGRVLPPEYIAQVAALARRHQLRLHLDGARIFNAACALGVPPAELVREADSVMFCLSKGLSCPVGSMVVGDRDFIREARRNRKVLGGGMRQAGVLAAAGLVALEEMVDRLAEDHQHARRLAEGLADTLGIEVDPSAVETNILFFDLVDDSITPAQLAAGLRERGIIIGAGATRRIRMVTHYGIEAADVERALFAVHEVMADH